MYSRQFGGSATPAGGLKDLADLACDVGSGSDALAVLLDGGLLQAVEVTDQVVPLDGYASGAAAVSQFLLEDEGEEGTEDVAADRRVAGVVDGKARMASYTRAQPGST